MDEKQKKIDVAKQEIREIMLKQFVTQESDPTLCQLAKIDKAIACAIVDVACMFE